MHIALLADIHGNLPALEAVLDDVSRQTVDQIVVAGDLVGGPQSQEVIDRLRDLDCIPVRGNREEYWLDFGSGRAPAHWYEGEQWAGLRWEYHGAGRTTWEWIAALPEHQVLSLPGSAPIHIVHGSPASTTEVLYPGNDPALLSRFKEGLVLPDPPDLHRLETLLEQIDEPVLVCAHSHLSWHWTGGSRLVVNPGSVGHPCDGDPRARYMLLDWQDGAWQVIRRVVDYDLDRVRSIYHDSGYLAAGGAFVRAAFCGVMTGRNIAGLFLAYLRRLAADAGWAGRGAVPDAVWTRAAETFDWPVD